MANWCLNTLTLETETTFGAINELKAEFARIKEIIEAENCGELLFDEGERYIFYVQQPDEDSHSIVYDTKWSPNIEDLAALAQRKGVSFSLTYEELGNGLFGEYSYDQLTDTLSNRCLDQSDFNRVEEIDGADTYTFDGAGEYESNDELFEEMLAEKDFECVIFLHLETLTFPA